jgi:hypothetical protein
METILLVLLSPFMVIDHCLSDFRLYRRIWGGHWEKRLYPFGGVLWVRIKREDCYRMTGIRPAGIVGGSPYCEETGKAAYEGYIHCKCGRDLTRAPGVMGAHEGDPKTSSIYGYSCPCGRWPRFLWDLGWQYLGDSRDKRKEEWADRSFHGHKIPTLIRSEDLADDGSYTASCADCGASMTVTPNVVAADGTLRRRLDRVDEALNAPCLGIPDRTEADQGSPARL